MFHNLDRHEFHRSFSLSITHLSIKIVYYSFRNFVYLCSIFLYAIIWSCWNCLEVFSTKTSLLPSFTIKSISFPSFFFMLFSPFTFVLFMVLKFSLLPNDIFGTALWTNRIFLKLIHFVFDHSISV